MKQKVIAVSLCAVMAFTAIGCSTAWVTEAEQIAAALVPAALNILQLVSALEGQTVSAQDVAVVQQVSQEAQTDFQTVANLLNTYNSSPAASQPAVLAKIVAALQDAQQNLGAMMSELHIKDPATQAKVQAVVGIVLAEIQSMQALLPIVQGNVTFARGAVKVPNAKSFRKSYNAEMHRPTGNLVVDNVANKLHI